MFEICKCLNIWNSNIKCLQIWMFEKCLITFIVECWNFLTILDISNLTSFRSNISCQVRLAAKNPQILSKTAKAAAKWRWKCKSVRVSIAGSCCQVWKMGKSAEIQISKYSLVFSPIFSRAKILSHLSWLSCALCSAIVLDICLNYLQSLADRCCEF